jgi:hypothetical protein
MKVQKLKKGALIAFQAIVTLGCYFIIFVIAPQLSPVEQSAWRKNFIILFLQDLLITPAGTLGVKLLLYKLYGRWKKSFIKKIIGDEVFEVKVKFIISWLTSIGRRENIICCLSL